jgi:hypothetical protein
MFIVLVELDVLAVPVQPSRFSAPKVSYLQLLVEGF